MNSLQRLNKAQKETSKLVDFLVKRDWHDSPELLATLERAETDISKIVDDAVGNVLRELEGRYLEEAQTWANNKMTDMSGKHIAISQAERRKAQTEIKKIQNTINNLKVLQ